MEQPRLIRREHIDDKAWNACVANSNRPLVYASSWYLDALCESGWCGLVQGDYEAVFPLPFTHKWMLPVVYQPFFCQQLGLFAPADSTASYEDFLMAIPRRFLKVHLQLNSGHSFPSGLSTRRNLLLNLQRPYHEIIKGYSSDALKNLKRCDQAGISISEGVEHDRVITLYRQVWGPANPVLKDHHYAAFSAACEAAQKHGALWTLEARNNEGMAGMAIFLKNNHYLHYVCAAPTASGRKAGVMHAVIDHAVRKHAGLPMQLDFEGSEIPAVEAFYRKFGPEEDRYGVYTRRLF